MAIKIDLPGRKEHKGAATGRGTKVYTPDGNEIDGVCSIDISIRPDDLVIATINVCIEPGQTFENVHAMLGTENIEQIAEMHGYKLVPIEDE